MNGGDVGFFLVTTANYDSEVDSSSTRNEYQEYFLGGGGEAAGPWGGHPYPPQFCFWGVNRFQKEMGQGDVPGGGGGGGRYLGLTTLPPTYLLIVLKSGSLSLLEPSGPVKACSGIALPF